MLKRRTTVHQRGIKPPPVPQVPARLGQLVNTRVENSLSHPGTQLMLHAEEVHHNASNPAQVTSMNDVFYH